MILDIPRHNPLVRDLAWSITSPALLRRNDDGVCWPDDDWFSGLADAYRTTLDYLENSPEKLQEKIGNRKDHRLGGYFEALWSFWLHTNGRYHLLHANLPVRGKDRTIGEFDFLVEDRETGKTLHWEIAVKFYLGLADTRQAANWWGPAQRDRLDLKTRHMLEHQGRLSTQPEARELLKKLNIRIDETWLFMKGRLFYPAQRYNEAPPDCSPDHLRGFWLPGHALHGIQEGHWFPLERRQWLAPLTGVGPDVCLSASTLIDKWNRNPLTFPVCVARIENGRETERGFIVPDNWPEKIHPSRQVGG